MTLAPAVAAIHEYKRLEPLERSRADGREARAASWRALKEKHPSVGDVRGRGLFCAVELVKDRANKTPFNTQDEKLDGKPLVIDQVTAKMMSSRRLVPRLDQPLRHRAAAHHHRGRARRGLARARRGARHRRRRHLEPWPKIQPRRRPRRADAQSRARIEASPLYNDDLAPVPRRASATGRPTTTPRCGSRMAHCIPTYMLASGLIGAGHELVAGAAHDPARQHDRARRRSCSTRTPARSTASRSRSSRAPRYGTLGSNLPALMRALVACGWFGIQAWIGGAGAAHLLRTSLVPGLADAPRRGAVGGHTPTEWLSFLLFWGSTSSSSTAAWTCCAQVENWAAPFVLVMTGAAARLGGLARARARAAARAARASSTTFGEFWPVFVPSLTAMIGFWATLSLNMPDFTRFGRSQREQIVGQVVALPTTMSVFAAMGVIITSADGDHLRRGDLGSGASSSGTFTQPLVVVAISMFTVVVATLARQHRRQRRLAGERLRQRLPAAASASRPAASSPASSASLMQPWKLLADPSRLHLHLAARLLGRPRLDRRRADRHDNSDQLSSGGGRYRGRPDPRRDGARRRGSHYPRARTSSTPPSRATCCRWRGGVTSGRSRAADRRAARAGADQPGGYIQAFTCCFAVDRIARGGPHHRPARRVRLLARLRPPLKPPWPGQACSAGRERARDARSRRL